MMPALFEAIGYPQDVVVFSTLLSLRFDPPGKAKSQLDKDSNPAKIQSV